MTKVGEFDPGNSKVGLEWIWFVGFVMKVMELKLLLLCRRGDGVTFKF